MSMHLDRSRLRSCRSLFLTPLSRTPKTILSLSRLSFRKSQKLHIFLKNFKCGNVGIDCFFAHLSTGIEFVTVKCLVCLPQNVLVQFFYYFIYSVSVFRVTGIVYLQTFDSHCSNEQRFNKLRRARFALDVGDNSVVLP